MNDATSEKAVPRVQCRTRSIFGDTVYSCYCKLRLVTSMVGAEGTNIFYFDNPRSLEKALSGKNYIENYFYLLKST